MQQVATLSECRSWREEGVGPFRATKCRNQMCGDVVFLGFFFFACCKQRKTTTDSGLKHPHRYSKTCKVHVRTGNWQAHLFSKRYVPGSRGIDLILQR